MRSSQGTGAAAARLRLQVARIAPHFRIALLTGERGVGKQVVAREMHRRSPLADDAFLAMHVAEFVECEELALARGTIYLHGLESSHPGLQQPLLLRLRALPREVHVIFGCELELKGMVATGRLRAELFDAIAMIELRVLPLRERLDDLEGLATSLLRRDGRTAWFAPSAMERMSAHAWPGNLQELARMCEDLGERDGAIEAHQLPALEGSPVKVRRPAGRGDARSM